jgi:hypothetical protein
MILTMPSPPSAWSNPVPVRTVKSPDKFPGNVDCMNDIITHSTDAFNWFPKERHFVAERSEVNNAEPWMVAPEGNYVNAYFYLRNPKTGNKVLFVHLHTIESDGPDSEVEAHVFGATPEECEKNPRLFGVEVHLLND